jgi:hypothetical protein
VRTSLVVAIVVGSPLLPAVARAEPLRATVVDGATLEPVAHANARAGDRDIVVGDHGELAIESERAIDVTVTAPGYEPTTQSVTPGEPVLVLLWKPGALDEVVEVHARAPRRASESSYLITRDEIRSLPGGSTDALAAVRSLPGVGSSPAVAGGRLVIRGGAPQDSAMSIDGVPVPFVYHSFDNTTILPLEMVGGMSYSPGGFGVEEGRATSGFVGILTNDTPPVRPTAQASLSMLDASALGAVPLSVAHGLYLTGAGRRSTVDLLIPIAVPDSVMIGFTTPPRYYDGQLRLDWIASARDRVTLLALSSYDRLGIVNHMMDSDLPADFDQDARFARLIASWKHESARVKNRLVGALGTSDLRAKFDVIQHIDDHARLAMMRDDLVIEASPAVRARAGMYASVETDALDALSVVVGPDGLPPGHFYDLPVQEVDQTIVTRYTAAYAALDVTPTAATSITGGVRVDHFGRIRATVAEPRIEIAHRIQELTLHAALGRYARDLAQLQAIPRDLSPEQATQASAGADVALGEGLTASATVYHTGRSQLAVEDPASPDHLGFRSEGSGTTNGVDLLLRVQRDRLFGWLAYSYGKTRRRDTEMTAAHATPFDQTHTLTAVGSYRTGRWQLGARFQLATGLPYTDVVGATYDRALDRYMPVLGAAYAARYPDVVQIDLRIERMWQLRNIKLAAFADLKNVFRNARVERYTYSTDFAERRPLSEYVPLPSIGIRGEM